MRRSRARTIVALVVVLSLAGTSCTDSESATPTESTVPAPPEAAPMTDEDQAALGDELDAAPGCDPLDGNACLLPFPSDRFTEDDPALPTGKRIAFDSGVMPVNAAGTPIDPAGWSGNDGFSPGTPMLAMVPGVDLSASAAPPIDDVAASLDEGSGVVVVDLDTGDRVPVWAELDADAADEGDQLVVVRPARNLVAGHRHAVGFVGLVGDDGAPIEPSLAFRAYRDNLTTDLPEIEDQREQLESALAGLAAAGVPREELTLAWGFTVASTENITGSLLAMRDDALEVVGDGSPPFTVTAVTEGPGGDLDEGIARVVTGTYEVPSYLSDDGGPGSTLHDPDADGLPDRNGTITVPFTCQVPASALDEPARPVVYGHGLLGSNQEVTSGHVAATATANNMVYCATDWIGMSSTDLPTVAAILGDLSDFPKLPDRSQQGILDTVLLGRLLRDDAGLVTDPAFQNGSGDPVIAGGDAFYDGNSQGGIMGAAATAVSTEWERAVLGVPGMNYSTLLRRSVDFVGKPGELSFDDVLVPAYPDAVDRATGFGLIQMLWDRAEANGYAAHLTDDPLPGTPSHQVVLHVAFGDHQVADVTAQVMARTAGIPVRGPALADGRTSGDLWGLEVAESFPLDGSVLVIWDSGTLPAPQVPISPVESDEFGTTCPIGADGEPPQTDQCEDPHEDPRRQPAAIEQKGAFLRADGEVVDTCASEPCRATPRFELD